MIDTTFVICVLGILLFFGFITFLCWWDLNGYKIKERQRQARQKLIDAANAEAERKTTMEESLKTAGKRA